jgi:hypothetical protein
MKLLFENWRKYLKEDDDPVMNKEIEELITNKFSFNSLQGKDHHFTPGEPVVNYWLEGGEFKFVAWTNSSLEKANKSPDLESAPGETLEAFLARVKEASFQIELDVLKELSLPFSSQAKMEKAVEELNPDQQNLLQKLKDHFTDCPSEEEFKHIIVKLVGVTALAPGGLIYGSGALLYNLIKMAKCHGLAEESLYYGTSTIFQEEIAENGIKAPSEWGSYGLAEENAMKIVEKHGGEPAVIQIPLSEFKNEHFLLDESNNDVILYTEDFHISMEKQEKKLV